MDGLINVIKNYQIIIGFVAMIITYGITFWKYFKKPIEILNDRMEMVEQSEKAVLTSRIFSICEDALRRGWTSIEEMKNVDAIFQAYTNYGLNGAAHEIYERFKDLPIKEIGNDRAG